MKNKKSKLIIEIVIILVLIIALGIVILSLSKEETFTSSDMDDALREMSEKYYKDYYYDNISKENVKKYLQQFKDKGITVTLYDLYEYDPNNNTPIIDKFVKNGNACNRDETKAIIYPCSPYGRDNINVVSIIDCD